VTREQVVAGLRPLLELPVDVVLPAHGAPTDRAALERALLSAKWTGALSFQGMRGIRYFFRNFTALAVKEHLRSQIERTGSGAELTPKEVELVRFAADRSDQLTELADRSPGK